MSRNITCIEDVDQIPGLCNEISHYMVENGGKLTPTDYIVKIDVKLYDGGNRPDVINTLIDMSFAENIDTLQTIITQYKEWYDDLVYIEVSY